MPEPRTTICVVPRDKFVHAVPSLSSVLAATPPPRRLVYVDGGSPAPVRDALARLAVEHDFTLLRTDHYLAPNEARNLALGHVTTEFALFVDNDVFVDNDQWVPTFEASADAHDATAIAPVYGIASGALDQPRVHHAGANAHVVDDDRERRLDTTRYIEENADPDAVLPGIVARETEQVEFHCFFVRTDALIALGGFDENMMAVHEHVDFSMRLRAQGGTIWLEPSVFVTYLVGDPAWSERSYQLLRWSQGWTETSLRRFATTWDLPRDAFGADGLLQFAAANRARAYRPYRSVIGRLSATRQRLSRSIPDRTIGTVVYRREERRRALGGSPRVAHRATWDR
jgi:GT2 family glycosyltransferase